MMKPPSTVERALAVLKGASGPMAFPAILEAILAEGPISSKDPAANLRSAIANTSLIVATGDGRYEYVPRAATGSIVRQRLSMEDASQGVIVWERDATIAIWPSAWDITASRRDHGPRSFRFGEDQHIVLDYRFLAPSRWGSVAAEPVWAWLRGQGAAPGDAVLVRILDSEARQVELTFEPRAKRDEEAIRQRNAEVAERLEGILTRRSDRTMFVHGAVAELIVQGAFRSPTPPDPLAEIVAGDERFAMDSISIALRARPPVSRGGWVLDPRPQPASRTASRTGGEERSRIYQLKVTLQGIRPPIWRRIRVPAAITLGQLHQVLQVVMGWEDGHLHQFVVDGTRYGPPDPEASWGDGTEDERRSTLGAVAPAEKRKLVYEYDFGDSWTHEVLVEKILPPAERAASPVCLAGKRACPPEDCGGVWGYMNLLEALQDPDHPEHDEMVEWVGEEFDPEAFDLDGVNRRLKRLR